MNHDEEKQKLFQDLIDAGFDKTQSEKAIANSSVKSFDACVEYIECLQRACEEKSRRKHLNELEEKKNKREEEEMAEELRKKAIQDIKDKEYLQTLKEKIEADKKEREMKDSLSSSSDVVKTASVNLAVGKDMCRIRIRFDDGVSKIYAFKKDSGVQEIFEIVKGYYGGYDAQLKDLNFVPIKNEVKSLEDAGFYPSKVIIATRK